MLELKIGNKYQRIGHPDSHIREIIDLSELNEIITYKYYYPNIPSMYYVTTCYIKDFLVETEPYIEKESVNEISDTSH